VKSNDTYSQIAYSVGFSDPKYFSQMLQKRNRTVVHREETRPYNSHILIHIIAAAKCHIRHIDKRRCYHHDTRPDSRAPILLEAITPLDIRHLIVSDTVLTDTQHEIAVRVSYGKYTGIYDIHRISHHHQEHDRPEGHHHAAYHIPQHAGPLYIPTVCQKSSHPRIPYASSNDAALRLHHSSITCHSSSNLNLSCPSSGISPSIPNSAIFSITLAGTFALFFRSCCDTNSPSFAASSS